MSKRMFTLGMVIDCLIIIALIVAADYYGGRNWILFTISLLFIGIVVFDMICAYQKYSYVLFEPVVDVHFDGEDCTLPADGELPGFCGSTTCKKRTFWCLDCTCASCDKQSNSQCVCCDGTKDGPESAYIAKA